jgi:hypothetical protein
MSKQNNLEDSEQEKHTDSALTRGWKDFINGFKNNFNEFQKSLETQSQKNKELWAKNKDKINTFFTDMKQNWDRKIQKLNSDIEKSKIETKEQLNAYKEKVKQDFKKWEEKAREEWQEGIKSFRKGFFKAYFWALLLILPVLIIIIVVLVIVNRYLGG